MALLRVRVELQRPNKGIEMPKLARLAEETQKFLRLVAEDLGIDTDGTWVAQDFYNQGIGFDAEYQIADIDQPQVDAYIHTIDAVMSVGPERHWSVPRVRPQTLVQSARLATLAADNETVRLGLYNGDTPAVEWRPLTKDRAAAILQHFEDWVTYRGMIQGIIHSLFKESQPSYFDIRDLASGDLIKCFYQPAMYSEVYEALERKDAIVLVGGWIRARRSDRKIADVKVEKIKPTKPLNEAQLRAFFGSAPGWTGDLTTEQFIERARGSDDS